MIENIDTLKGWQIMQEELIRPEPDNPPDNMDIGELVVKDLDDLNPFVAKHLTEPKVNLYFQKTRALWKGLGTAGLSCNLDWLQQKFDWKLVQGRYQMDVVSPLNLTDDIKRMCSAKGYSVVKHQAPAPKKGASAK